MKFVTSGTYRRLWKNAVLKNSVQKDDEDSMCVPRAGVILLAVSDDRSLFNTSRFRCKYFRKEDLTKRGKSECDTLIDAQCQRKGLDQSNKQASLMLRCAWMIARNNRTPRPLRVPNVFIPQAKTTWHKKIPQEKKHMIETI